MANVFLILNPEDSIMLINDFRVQLATAYPDLEPFRSGRHLKFRGRIRTDDGDKRAYIKILNIGDVAKEALCAVLARKLHLPVPQPFYVQVDPSYTEMGAGGIAFATEEELVPFPRIVDFEFLERELLKWSEVNKCATFDA